MNLSQETLALLKGLRKDVTTNGLNIGSQLNFTYLEPQAKALYPVFYPLLASTARVNPMFGGMKVGGTAVNWKAIVGIDNGGYAGVSEGNRNEFMNMTTRNYSANYKFIGKDTQVSFQAQSTGEGFDNNIALAQAGMLNALLNDEERMLLYGNSGTAGNGYQLGTSPTPVAALATAAGTIPTSTNCSLFCIALTPYGVKAATTTGVALPRLRTNADGSTDVINGGTGAVSAASNIVVTAGTNRGVVGTVAAVNGAVGYAWFLDSTDATTPATANAVFAGVTAFPTITILALPSGTNQKANASNASGNLTTDNSANALDFDGLLTWGFNTFGSSQPAYLKDLGGAGFTSNGDGTIKEFEAALDFLWLNYQITPDKIYCGGNLITAITGAILSSAGGTGSAKYEFQATDGGRVIGGTKSVGYRCKYSDTGAEKVLPIQTHPWLPNGVVYFDLTRNPYPAAGNSIPNVRRIVSLEDHFSLVWPKRRLQHEVGVYAFETLEHYIPFGCGIITGAANTHS